MTATIIVIASAIILVTIVTMWGRKQVNDMVDLADMYKRAYETGEVKTMVLIKHIQKLTKSDNVHFTITLDKEYFAKVIEDVKEQQQTTIYVPKSDPEQDTIDVSIFPV